MQFNAQRRRAIISSLMQYLSSFTPSSAPRAAPPARRVNPPRLVSAERAVDKSYPSWLSSPPLTPLPHDFLRPLQASIHHWLPWVGYLTNPPTAPANRHPPPTAPLTPPSSRRPSATRLRLILVPLARGMWRPFLRSGITCPNCNFAGTRRRDRGCRVERASAIRPDGAATHYFPRRVVPETSQLLGRPRWRPLVEAAPPPF